MNHALMIAFHFPPFQGSSGVLRTVAFSRHIQDHGWHPIILAPRAMAYPSVADDLNKGVPDGVIVHRSFALDSARHLSFQGKYLRTSALPDRWISWWPGAIIAGLRLIRKYKPRVIWSTFPIATAHLIAYTLHKITGIPWIADFRDPMVYENWPEEKILRKLNSRIERATVESCNLAVCTTPGAQKLYEERYPDIDSNNWKIIPNGFDETLFKQLSNSEPIEHHSTNAITLLHSGLMEMPDRSPEYFFEALAGLVANKKILEGDLKVTLRATGREEKYKNMIRLKGLESIVNLAPPIPYQDALKEMAHSDGLLLFQGPDCNRQVPAKLYEYFRIGKPIIAMTDKTGDTAKVLADAGIKPIYPYDSVTDIRSALLSFINEVRSGSAQGVPRYVADRYSRAEGAARLAELFNQVSH